MTTDKVVIGLTGNIGTGKTLVLRMLQELGATVVDADKLVHQIMKKGTPVYDAIIKEFGKYILDEKGEINRKKLGSVVFKAPEAMKKLEAITHPVVRQVIVHRIKKAQTQAVAVEAIKLFESGLVEHCDSAWVVTAPPEVQLKRLVERRKMSSDDAKLRIKAQGSPQEKVAKANVVIDNSGEVVKTWNAVKNNYTALLQGNEAAAPKPKPTPSPQPAAAPPKKQAANVDTSNVEIRRAKRDDLQAMASVIAAGTNGAIDPDISQMMESLFSRAYIVATAEGQPVGIAGWQTENLIAGIEDFYVRQADMWPTVGKQMLDMIHEEINNLSCEVSIVFVKQQAGQEPIKFFESEGYELSESDKLGYMWKDAAEEWQPENSVLLYKKLRDQRIMVPM